MLNNNSMLDTITEIVNIVLFKHFSYVKDECLREDLKQEGFHKAYELLKIGNYDPTKSLGTYLYTGIRNAMTNYMYHSNKETHAGIDDEVRDFYFEDSEACSFEIDKDIVLDVCKKYLVYGDYSGIILSYFKKMKMYSGPIPKIDVVEIEEVKSAIIVEVIWKITEN